MKNVEIGQLDLASPNSIDRFANAFLSSNRPLDLLINNAGIMATPLMRDDRGYEMQFATNHWAFSVDGTMWEGKIAVMRGWWPFLPAVMPGVKLISATRILTRGRMTNGQLRAIEERKFTICR